MGVSKRSQHSVLALLQSPTPSPKDSSSPPSWNPLTEANASLAQRRLTRQRKLRHVTDHELGRDNSSFAGVPQPLPLPADRSIRRDVDQVTTTTNRCHVRSTAISVRSSAGDIISSFHADEEDDEEAKRKASFPSRSAPASPRRASDAPKLLNLSGGNAARIAVAGGISQKAISFPVCYKNSFPAESPSSGAHPLPRPPGSGNPPARNQWQKGKLIGRGTFGSVYVGVNKETGASCAMKEVDLILDDPKSVECIKQLEQEIEMLRQLKHPNIVQYYGSEVVDGHFYIYLEYVYPGSINKYVREHFGAVTESVIRNFTRHILSGLAYLHSRKTVHRDIKGANLLVDTSGAVKLADFGMAKHLTGHSYDLSLKGSPYWMAPEVIKAAMQRNASPDLALAVDIWSLGCTIIEMINGKPPWSEFTAPQAMFKVLNSAPPIPENLSSEGKDFLNCCFRRNPVERPSAAKLLDHSFVRNLHQQNLSPSAHHVMEKLHIQRDRRKDAFDLAVAYSSARVRTSNRSPPSVVDTSSTWTLSL